MAEAHIVMIHGLASKPPRKKLAKRYLRYLCESTRQQIPEDRFHSAYWADIMGYLPPDGPQDDEYTDGADNFEQYSELEAAKYKVLSRLRRPFADAAEYYLERAMGGTESVEGGATGMIDVLPRLLANAPARHIYRHFLPDLHRYFFRNNRFRKPVRNRLRKQLAKVPDDGSVCLIAHSMGSIIAADVLIADRLKVDRLITIGSPLGLRVVQENLGINDTVRRRLSQQVGKWFNLYDPFDIVALDTDLADDFSPAPVTDLRIRNEFVSRKGDRNHHKSYGYLRTPQLGQIVSSFLQENS